MQRPLFPDRAAKLGLVAIALVAASAGAHDLFLKPRHFFAPPNSDVPILVINGTFTKSENSITRDRLISIGVRGPGGATAIDTSDWDASGDTSRLTVRVGESGTYAIAASTRPRMIELTAKEFNEYLRTDGIPDVLEARRRRGELQRGARERYHKHVKGIVQVGATRTDEPADAFGHPAELVPVDHPYQVRVGQTLRVRALVDGQPAANQYVVAGGRTWAGGRIVQRGVRTDSMGVARIPIRARGAWYIKFIHMTRLENDAEADYESRWASLTFGVR